jgi:hypothetical protein
MKQISLSFHKNFCRRLLKKNIIITILLSVLITSNQSYAEDPSAAFVFKLGGSSHSVRRGSKNKPDAIKLKDLLNPEDTLYIPGDQQSWASLGFVIANVLDYAGLILKTQPYSKTSEYRFPCRALGGFTIAWRPVGEGNRACSEGLKVERGSSVVYSNSYFFRKEATSQAYRPNSKQNIKTQNPIERTPTDLSDDLLIQPGKNQIVIRATNEPSVEDQWIIERSDYTPERGEWEQKKVTVRRNAVRIDVLEGEIVVKSKASSQGKTVRKGERYSHPEGAIIPINSAEIANSCETLKFLNAAYWSSPDTPKAISDKIAKQLKQHREALGVSGRPPSDLSPLERSIFDEINFARSNPNGYANDLEKQKRYFYTNYLNLPGEAVDPNRRVKAVDEAISFLRKQRTLPPLSVSRGMTKANRDHVNNQGASGKNFGHTGDNFSGSAARLRRYGAVGCARYDEDEFENIVYFKQSKDQGVVPLNRAIFMEMLINYRSRRTGKPDNLFNQDFQVTGVACGSHGDFLHEMCVISYAEGYLEKN